MNTIAQAAPWFDADAYLAWEKTQTEKHEYIHGEVFAMVGARDAHVTVALNLASGLKSHLRGGPCRVYMSDMKLRVETADAFFYPDVFVTCDERDRATDYYKSHPTLVVEVLSDSTAAFDYGRKFAMYRQLASLQEYVLIDPDNFTVDGFRRDDSGHWVLYAFEGEDELELRSVALRIPLSALFEGVERSAAPANPPTNRGP